MDRGRFAWLLLSALLFIPEVAGFALWHWLATEYWPPWLNHLALAGAMVVMAANVAAYDRLRHGQMIRTDLLYFLTAWALGAVAYVAAALVVGGGYSFRWLGLVVATLSLLVLSHGLVDVARPAFDRLFLGRDAERVRSNLSSVVQSAAMTPDLGALLDQAQADIAAASSEHLVRLTEEGLRRLNKPAALTDCGLMGRIPRTVAAHADRDGARPGEATPVEQARALREVLVLAIERLKPPERDTAPGSPSALQYHILREEYVQELPNKHIMTRHSISEGTFHRNRRSAISLLARELAKQEDLLSRGQS